MKSNKEVDGLIEKVLSKCNHFILYLLFFLWVFSSAIFGMGMTKNFVLETKWSTTLPHLQKNWRNHLLM